MTQPLRVGMAGLGTVGCGVVQLLIQDAPSIAKRAGRSILLARVASRTPKAEVDLGDASFDTDLCSLTDADDVDVVVECIGGEDAAKGLFEAAIDASKHFVTANKALIALHGNELLGRAHVLIFQLLHSWMCPDFYPALNRNGAE